jgi:hypothetical protein
MYFQKQVKVKTYQRKNGYPPNYYASESDMKNPMLRTARPASTPNESGTFRNGRITSMRVSVDES